MKRWLPWIIVVITIASPIFAVTLPKTWVASETIKASDLNNNFNALNNAYSNHPKLSNLGYAVASHSGFCPEGGLYDRYLGAIRFIDYSGQIIHPVIQTTALPVATATEYNALYLLRGSENVLYMLSGNATGVPTMTNYTTPVGSVLYSDVETGYQAWKAFDASSTTRWRSGEGFPQYIGYSFTASKTINAVQITPYSYFDKNPTDFTIEYSDLPASTTAWVVVATYTDLPIPETGVELYVASGTEHMHWRLNISDANTLDDDIVDLIEVDFREYTKAFVPVVPPSWSQGITATFTLPYEFGVSSWTLGIANGLVASITTP